MSFVKKDFFKKMTRTQHSNHSQIARDCSRYFLDKNNILILFPIKKKIRCF